MTPMAMPPTATLPTTDWKPVLERAQELLASGRTVAYAVCTCGVRRSELEQRLPAAVTGFSSEVAARQLLSGPFQYLSFPEEMVGRRRDAGRPLPLPTILATIEDARSSLDFEFRDRTCSQVRMLFVTNVLHFMDVLRAEPYVFADRGRCRARAPARGRGGVRDHVQVPGGAPASRVDCLLEAGVRSSGARGSTLLCVACCCGDCMGG